MILIILYLVSAMAGRFSLSFSELILVCKEHFSGQTPTYAMAETVLFQSRFPRITAAVLIGCGLSMSGAAYQGLFRNPMVSPDLLGASAGAGFGAALGFLLGVSSMSVQIMAFFSGLMAVLFTCFISKMTGMHEQNRILLVLSGMITGALFQALISMIKYVADPFDTMPSIAFWLMGGLTYVTARDVIFLAVPVFIGTILLLLIRWRINLLSFGEEEAQAMGVPVKKYQSIIIFLATIMTASCVSIGGLIGWVGLIVPHFARMIAGPDYKKMLPCAGLLGAIFLLAVDDIARCAFPQELPIGILTAMIGASVFIILLSKEKKGFL
jgi:iron complex transport system permease protein